MTNERKWTRSEVVAELERSDHLMLSQRFARAACRAFGVPMVRIQRERVGEDWKGLEEVWTPDGEPTDVANGVCAAALAAHLCRKSGVEFAFKVGRGFRLQECCERLRAHLDA